METKPDDPESMHMVALITGASSGLGAEYARQLAAKGYDLILVARREDRLVEIGNQLGAKFGVRTSIVRADLSVLAEIEKVVSVINGSPNLELLVNNAGFGTTGRFVRVDPGKELAMIQVHITAPVMLSRAILPVLINQDRGAIINVASIASVIPVRSILYSATKEFLVNFSEYLQAELNNTRVRVQALCPGFILSEFHDTPEYARFSRSSIPKFLWMTPEQVVTASLKSLREHKVICVPGNIYKIIEALGRNSITAGLTKLAARIVLLKRKH